MQQNGIPDGAQPPAHHDGILDHLGQLAEKFLGRHQDVAIPLAPDLQPVIDTRLVTPPYPVMAEEAPGRYQQEVHLLSLTTATAPSGSARFQTRCDFYTIAVYPRVAATTTDPANGVWVALSGTPPSLPLLTPGTPTRGSLRAWVGTVLKLHGSEQQLAFQLDSAIDLTVIIVANTNVHSPY